MSTDRRAKARQDISAAGYATGGSVRSLGDRVAKGGMDDIESQNYDYSKKKGFDKGESRYHATNPPGRLSPEGTPDPWGPGTDEHSETGAPQDKAKGGLVRKRRAKK